MEYVIDVRAAEGGEDSKLLVGDFAAAYRRMMDSSG